MTQPDARLLKMKNLKIQIIALPILLLAACSNPADKVPAAQVSSSTNTAAAASSGAEGRVLAINPAASKVEFIGSKVTGSHSGGFTNFSGELKVANGKLSAAGSKVVIEMASLWADNDRLAGHLKNADFFDVAKFTTSIFETVSIAEQATNSVITGNLTMHGVTKQISFPAVVQVSQDKVSLSAEFAINRFDFDMKFAGKSDDLIRKEVVLKLNVSAAPAKL